MIRVHPHVRTRCRWVALVEERFGGATIRGSGDNTCPLKAIYEALITARAATRWPAPSWKELERMRLRGPDAMGKPYRR